MYMQVNNNTFTLCSARDVMQWLERRGASYKESWQSGRSTRRRSEGTYRRDLDM